MEYEAVLLKIKRIYGKDESISFLIKTISDLRIEIGILKSEISELKHLNSSIKNSLVAEGSKRQKQWLKEDIIAQMQKGIATCDKRNKLLQKQKNDIQDKYYSLLYESIK